jgi:hypothetical protein
MVLLAHTSKVTRGSNRGDPLSPILFNLAAECLTKMVCKAQQNNLVTGLCSDIIPGGGGVAILQYADDTILCMENDLNMARNMKLLLYVFEQMVVLKINFDKSGVLAIGGDNRT